MILRDSELPVCSLELAKLLKEVNFTWDSDYYYDNNGGLDEFQYFHFARNYVDFNGWPEDVKYFAPTLELVKQWFRVVHGINIIVELDETKLIWFYNYEYLSNKKRSFCDTTSYNTYEETLETCLKELCKLIK